MGRTKRKLERAITPLMNTSAIEMVKSYMLLLSRMQDGVTGIIVT